MKKKFVYRMKMGAIGSMLIVPWVIFNEMSNKSIIPAPFFITVSFMFGLPAVGIYFLRLKFAEKANRYTERKMKDDKSAIVIKLVSQILAIIVGYGLGLLSFVVVFGGLYLIAR